MLMATFGWSYHYVRFELTGAQSWVWYSWAKENLMTAFGPVFKRKTDGYIRQETKRLVAVAKDFYAKSKKMKK